MERPRPIEIQKYLKGADYPASKQSLIELARKHGADKEVLSALDALPDEEFETPAEVSQAVARKH